MASESAIKMRPGPVDEKIRHLVETLSIASSPALPENFASSIEESLAAIKGHHSTSMTPLLNTDAAPIDSSIQLPDEEAEHEVALSAASRVLQTTELLEAILAEMPNRQLLLSQRTCKIFLETIRGSSLLQRKLFLAPAGSVSDLPSFNPLLGMVGTGRVPEGCNREKCLGFGAVGEDDDINVAFAFNGDLYALSLGVLPNREGDDLQWGIMQVTPSEVQSARIFNICDTSLWDMQVCQPQVDFRVHLYGCTEWHSEYKERAPIMGRFQACGSIREIFEEADRVPGW